MVAKFTEVLNYVLATLDCTKIFHFKIEKKSGKGHGHCPSLPFIHSTLCVKGTPLPTLKPLRRSGPTLNCSTWPFVSFTLATVLSVPEQPFEPVARKV